MRLRAVGNLTALTTLGAVRIFPGSSGDYGYARLDTLPSAFGTGEFALELWLKATTAGIAVGSTVSVKTNRWSSDNVTPYSDPFWLYYGNFILDGHNNGAGTVQNGTFSLQTYNSGRIRWTFSDGAAADARVGDCHAVQGTTSIFDDLWHSIVCVRRWDGGSGAVLELWIDGVLEGTETTSARTNMHTYWSNMAAVGYPVGERNWMFGAEKIAANGGSEWEHYMGLIDRVRFYDRAPTSTELSNGVITSGLVAGYEFSEGAGASVADSQGGASMALVDSDQYQWVANDGA